MRLLDSNAAREVLRIRKIGLAQPEDMRLASPTTIKQHDSSLLIGRGNQAVVEFDPRSKLVRKTFFAPDCTLAATQSRREFQYLRAYSSAVADEPLIGCPEPVRVEPRQARLWMTFCAGHRLDQLLADRGEIVEPHLERIAERAARALEAYVRTFNEPYSDFTTANILYDPATGILSLIDFGDPEIYVDYEFQDVQFDLSIGNFIASTTEHTVRRRTIWNLGYWRRQKQLTLALLRVVGAHHCLRLDVIRQVQAHKFKGYEEHGSILQMAWCLTVKKLVYWWRVRSIITALEG